MGRLARASQAILYRRGALSRASLLVAILSLGAPQARSDGRVVLVGVDGGSWNVIDALLAKGELPHLAEVAHRGVTAELATVEPVISPTIWTSIATGRRPAAHGVTDFLASRFSIRTPTIFERLAAQGYRVGLYDYLLTWPPAEFAGGFIIPGWLRRSDAVTPPDVWERIGTSPYVLDYSRAHTFDEFIALARSEVKEKPMRFLRLLDSFQVQLGSVVLYAVDNTSHRAWHIDYPEDFPEGAPRSVQPRGAIADAVRGVDRAIGLIQAALGPEDVLLIASDHGFHADVRDGHTVWWGTQLPRILSESGLDPEKDGFGVIYTFGFIGLRIHPGELGERDVLLERLLDLLRSIRAADGTALYQVEFVDTMERPPRAERAITTRMRQWVVRKVLAWWYDVHVDEEIGHSVILALPRGGALDALWPDGEISVDGRRARVSDVVYPSLYTGEHDPTAVFLASGGPIRHLSTRERLSVLDVAPLISYLVSGAVPDDLEGSVPMSLIRGDYAESHPLRFVASGSLPTLPGIQSPLGSERSDEELNAMLRSLGYAR